MRKQRVSVMLCAVMTASVLCAVPAAAEEERTIINYWVNDRHDSEYMADVIDRFNKENEDGIYVDMQIITDNYETVIADAYAGDSAPDIIGATVTMKNFAESGMVIPLNEYIDGDEEYRKVNEPYQHAYEGLNALNGDIYWVYSGMRSGVRIEYNKDVLEENGYTGIPKTLEEYIEMATALTEAGDGIYYGIGFTSSSPFERLLEAAAQISGIYYYDYENGKFDFSGYKEILELGRRFIDEGAAYPEQQSVDNMRALFAKGEFVLWSNASQEAGVFTEQLPVEDFEWGVAEVPSLTGEIKGALQITPTKSYAIMSGCKNPDAAWEVIRYLQSEEVLKGYLEGGFCLPISTYMDGLIDKSGIGRLADFSLLEYESVYPAVPVVNPSGDDYRTVLWNAVMGYVDIDKAIEDLNTRYNDTYEEAIASGSVRRLVIDDYDPLHPGDGTVTYLDE